MFDKSRSISHFYDFRFSSAPNGTIPGSFLNPLMAFRFQIVLQSPKKKRSWPKNGGICDLINHCLWKRLEGLLPNALAAQLLLPRCKPIAEQSQENTHRLKPHPTVLTCRVFNEGSNSLIGCLYWYKFTLWSICDTFSARKKEK